MLQATTHRFCEPRIRCRIHPATYSAPKNKAEVCIALPAYVSGRGLACKFNMPISLSFSDTLRGVWGSQGQPHLMSVRHHVNGTDRMGTEIYHKWNRQFHSEPFSVKLLNPCIICTFFVCVIIMTFSTHFLWGSNLRNSKHWDIETGSAKREWLKCNNVFFWHLKRYFFLLPGSYVIFD